MTTIHSHMKLQYRPILGFVLQGLRLKGQGLKSLDCEIKRADQCANCTITASI